MSPIHINYRLGLAINDQPVRYCQMDSRSYQVVVQSPSDGYKAHDIYRLDTFSPIVKLESFSPSEFTNYV